VVSVGFVLLSLVFIVMGHVNAGKPVVKALTKNQRRKKRVKR
jgi:heme exporter protein D